jgi:hypothetical protein
MFLLSPDIDMQLIVFLISVTFVVCLIIAFFVKEKIKVVVVFSTLVNLILFLFILYGTRIFYFYDILWLRTFAVLFWPIINIFLINKIFFSKR